MTQLTDQAGSHWMPDWSPDGTVIAYIADRAPHEGDFDLFTARLSDSTITRLTETAQSSERSPSWSPDGSAIAFVRDNIGQDQIVVVRKDGSNQRVLYACRDDCSALTSVAWAPDGTQLVFAAADERSVSQLFLINLDGSDVRQLTTRPEGASSPTWQPLPKLPSPTEALPTPESNPTVTEPSTRHQVAYEHDGGIWVTSDGEARRLAAGSEPSWSPDGALIAFRRESGSLQEVWVMTADGVDLRRVAQVQGNYEYSGPPAWSPDGQTLAFASEEGIWSGAVQGEEASLVLEPSEVVHGTGACYLEHPDWSTAGDIVFAVDCEGGGEGIFVMGSDGSGARIVAEAAPLQRYVQPSWSPDGRRIAFTIGDESGFWSIAVMQADGSGLVQLQPGEGYVETEPSWSPDGLRIVFAQSKPVGGSGFDLYSMNADGGDRTLVTSDPGDETAPDWGP